jgi:hypothetical protein
MFSGVLEWVGAAVWLAVCWTGAEAWSGVACDVLDWTGAESWDEMRWHAVL